MRYIITLSILILTGCTSQENGQAISVKSIGALREIMHQGKYQARVKLDTLATEGLYGLGASDSLSGEIMMMDGKVFEATVQDSLPYIQINPSAEATLLVYAKVDNWDTISVQAEADIEQLIAKQAFDKGIEAPFPFILIGKPEVSYHIINFDTQNGDMAHHKNGAYIGKIKNEAVTILGFYATDAKGVYTHHDSNLHMHVLNGRKTQMGHVEDISWGENDIQLLIPRI
ncbi:acetolactate decarboxylase [Marivirga atlantica]|jgi:acetolactate decarboxylase|uniref:Acetolactate decarboxylase n=1 Tax=Marivirga atlantica TaxID=1548457 RepID=A0A937AAQ0_9BACT|nr:acetolactate decarboxylase [Marivirga atlantica]MBL0766720.1 acetolactate decarboxylase [Marivirga atlantica]